MAMKFGRAYCDQLKDTLTPYRARELFISEDSEYFGQELTFRCENQCCRVRLTPVGIYMTRRSKRALHFRSKDEHMTGCGFLHGSLVNGKNRKPSEIEDDYKLTDFPTELDLKPPKRRLGAGGTDGEQENTEGSSGGVGGNYLGSDKRKTSTRTRHLDHVVDCFLFGDDEGKKGAFTIAGKTKPFSTFFKKVEYFNDGMGLIYYGKVDALRVYKNMGVGIRFARFHREEESSFRIWLHIPQESINESPKRKAFLKEMEELQKAVDLKEEVIAFFVGSYPEKISVSNKSGGSFEVYQAELLNVNHLSLIFATADDLQSLKLK